MCDGSCDDEPENDIDKQTIHQMEGPAGAKYALLTLLKLRNPILLLKFRILML